MSEMPISIELLFIFLFGVDTCYFRVSKPIRLFIKITGSNYCYTICKFQLKRNSFDLHLKSLPKRSSNIS
jgi:hypothetical protein